MVHVLLRWYADEFVPSVVIRQFKFQGQKAMTAVRPVFDVGKSCRLFGRPLATSYHHLFRLAVFGISRAQVPVSWFSRRLKRWQSRAITFWVDLRRRIDHAAVIINKTHERLLIKFGKGSIVGEQTAHQTSSNHSKIIKDGLRKATGNAVLSAYSGRHTGKHLCDLAGVGASDVVRVMFGWNEVGTLLPITMAAPVSGDYMIDEMKKVVGLMIRDLLIAII